MAGYLFRDVLRSCLSRSHRLAVLLFCLFSQPGGIPFCGFESHLLPFPFLYFSILVPRGAFHLRHKRSLVISSFLAGLFGACGFYSVSYFSFCHFLSNCLNLPLTVLMRLGGSTPLGGRWGSWLFLLQSLDVGFSSFLMLLLGFKPLGPTTPSLSWSPCTCFLGLGLFSFGLGSLLWAWALWSFLDLNNGIQVTSNITLNNINPLYIFNFLTECVFWQIYHLVTFSPYSFRTFK